MTEAMTTDPTGSAACENDRDGAASRAANLLCLVAAPAFAIMALLTGLSRTPDAVCSAADPSLLSGMAPMYVLMTIFHGAPWLKLVAGRRQAAAHRLGPGIRPIET